MTYEFGQMLDHPEHGRAVVVNGNISRKGYIIVYAESYGEVLMKVQTDREVYEAEYNKCYQCREHLVDGVCPYS